MSQRTDEFTLLLVLSLDSLLLIISAEQKTATCFVYIMAFPQAVTKLVY